MGKVFPLILKRLAHEAGTATVTHTDPSRLIWGFNKFLYTRICTWMKLLHLKQKHEVSRKALCTQIYIDLKYFLYMPDISNFIFHFSATKFILLIETFQTKYCIHMSKYDLSVLSVIARSKTHQLQWKFEACDLMWVLFLRNIWLYSYPYKYIYIYVRNCN
jgi:hypothetical protein